MSDAFEDLFLLERKRKSMPDLPYVCVAHPLGGVREPEIRSRGRAAAGAVIEAFAQRAQT